MAYASSNKPAYYPQSAHRADGEHELHKSLSVEAVNLPRVGQLFNAVTITDISGSVIERSSGTDTLVHVPLSDGEKIVRIEHKFEQYTSGRVTYELCSVDRGPTFKAGWLFTSRAAWLMSWFPSGDILICHMDSLRKVLLANPARNKATTVKNKTYLSWNILEDINYILEYFPNSYVIDTRRALDETPACNTQVEFNNFGKRISVEQFLDIMREMPEVSPPIEVSPEEVYAYCRQIRHLDFKAQNHAHLINALPWINAVA